MNSLRSALLSALIAPLLLGGLPAFGEEKAMLLDVTGGQTPTDTGTDKTKWVIEPVKEMGDRNMVKVEFMDSFGDRRARVTDWKPYETLKLEAYNPGTAPLNFEMNVKHKQSTNMKTRITLPFTLKPGKNEIAFPVKKMTNNNNQPANLADIVRWYINVAKKPSTPVTAYFGNIWLEGGSNVASAPK